MVCTFTGWVEVYPTKAEKAKDVAWFLPRDIIPRFGFPLSMESDNGPAFVAELLQLVCKAVNVKWKLHTMYRSQSSRNGWENELDHQGDFGKMGAGNWCSLPDGRDAISVNEDQNDPPGMGIPSMR